MLRNICPFCGWHNAYLALTTSSTMKTRVLALLIATILAVSASAQIAPVYSLSAPNAGGGADFLRFDLNQGTQTMVLLRPVQ